MKEDNNIIEDYYMNNPLIHKDRKAKESSMKWLAEFSCEHLKPLIICRGPIRKEAMDVFEEMGIKHYGILISEKDSIVYTYALAPELRQLKDPNRVHRVPDYSGATKEERLLRIEQIIRIAKENGYNSIFAGYGFMAEDDEMVRSMEEAGLTFIGPNSKTIKKAGLKDEAKRTAEKLEVSVTPGINNITALTLINKCPDKDSLIKLANTHSLIIEDSIIKDNSISLEDFADHILSASYEKGIDLYSIEELKNQVEKSIAEMFKEFPKNRIRLKAIGGGGGKGQRILKAPTSYNNSKLEDNIKEASSKAPEMVMEILNEVKTTGVGDNKNILIELNIESTRHQEIQVIGNGKWSMSLGARDCSLQMHEQKLLEVSVTQESLKAELDQDNSPERKSSLERDLYTLVKMEDEAERFAGAVGLDSVSTFECIVEEDRHFFMEMNTRIQVEHRVTELCYSLKFTNPNNHAEYFIVDSLVEAMVLLACHKETLPRPQRVIRKNSSVEARLNATNQVLEPHAGGIIEFWSNPIKDEIRDDQGICRHNPDTDVFVKYRLAGAYDSNVSLLLTFGENRKESYQKMAEILRQMKLRGRDLTTNLEFHYGLVNWFLSNDTHACPTTQFIKPYITAVGLLKEESQSLDHTYAFQEIKNAYLASFKVDDDYKKTLAQVIDLKQSLLLRPISWLLRDPHILSGWLSLNKDKFKIDNGRIYFLDNPVQILADTYNYLNMDYKENQPAADSIWQHDNEILKNAIEFYESLKTIITYNNFHELNEKMAVTTPPGEVEKDVWEQARAAHYGYQSGMEVLKLLPFIAVQTRFYDLKMNDDLSIYIPEKLMDSDLQEKVKKILVPPPMTSSDEILSVSGGMFYPRESPEMELYIKEGDHFEEGDPLYIIEVMKMFTKVYAPFAGTVVKTLIEGDGVIVSKGQPLFKVQPDEEIKVVDEKEIQKAKVEKTKIFLNTLNIN